MARYIEDRRETSLFVTGSLETLLPPDSVARTIAGALAHLDFAAFEAAYRNDEKGRPAVDPRRLAGVWVLALLRGFTSSVELARRCHEDVELRWLLGDAPVEKSTLCDFRKYHLTALRDLSTQVLAALARSGLLRGESLVLDGTVVQAAASCEASVTRGQLEKRVARLQETIQQKLEAEGPSEAVEALARRQARFETELEAMTALGQTADSDKRTLTDPEASLKKLKHGGFAPAHNVQAVSDAHSGALITVTVVAQGNDQGLLEPDVLEAQAELARVAQLVQSDAPEAAPGPVERVGADGAYHDTLQLKALGEQGVEACVPEGQGERQAPGVQPGFEASAFVHDAATDTMRCPQGQTLPRAGFNDGKTAARYRAPASTCGACPSKGACCPQAHAQGRTVNRPLYPEVKEAVARQTASPEGQRLKKARSVTCEGNFARLLERLHWRRCRTWGGAGAQAEGLWRQITHNVMLLIGAWKPLVLKEA